MNSSTLFSFVKHFLSCLLISFVIIVTVTATNSNGDIAYRLGYGLGYFFKFWWFFSMLLSVVVSLIWQTLVGKKVKLTEVVTAQDIAIEQVSPTNFFIHNAKFGRNSLWYFIVSQTLTFIFFTLGTLPLIGLMLQTGSTNTTKNFPLINVPNNLHLALTLLPYTFGAIGLWVSLKLIHKREMLTLITPNKNIQWGKILYGAIVWIVLSLTLDVTAWAINPDNYRLTLDAGNFLFAFIICIILIPIQAGVEEMMFRGYLMQNIALISKYSYVPLVLTTLVFALLHSFNPEINTYGFHRMMTGYCIVGLLLGIVTLMDEGLELALGIHIANNLYAALFVTFPSSILQTPALITIQKYDITAANLNLIIAAGMTLYIFARKYKWGTFFKLFSRLN